MTETDIDRFALNFNDKHVSLKVSILNNQQILLELTDKDTKQIYYNAVTLPQLKSVSKAFNSILTIKDAYYIIRNTIESGKIMIGETDNGAIEVEFNITLQTGTYPPFNVDLFMAQATANGLQVQELPPTFNYHGNKELEAKYGGITKDTTEVRSIVQSNVQQPMQLEYIQPVVQTHYPDGSVKNTPLPPRLQGQNISEKQLQEIQKSLALPGIQKNINYEEQSVLSKASKISKIQGQEDTQDIEDLYLTEEGKVIFRNGLLRGIIHKYAEIDDVVTKIQDIFLKGVRFNLVYKAFDLDDKARTFHEKCDKIETSLILVETNKDVRFGGFTTKSWRGNNVKKIDNYSFVFSLDNNKIFEVIPNQPAIGCYPNYGPVFFGCQMRIYDEFFTKGGTTCHKGLNFKTTKDYELNNGEKNFIVKDIEVYSLENMDVD